MRLLAAAIVLLISGCYLVPQLKGAGVTLRAVTGAPYWVGVAIVAAIVALNVGLGGMRGVTYVQAFQYWVKVFAIALPAILLLIHLGGLPARAALFGYELPEHRADGLVVELDRAADADVPGHAARRGPCPRASCGSRRTPPSRSPTASTRRPATSGRARSRESGRGSPLLIYSLLLATFLGTMGLPHILVRFYTNPDGSAARRTTVRVLGLLGVFYLFPAVYGLLGRAFTPELYVTGDTDSVVLRVPAAAWPGLRRRHPGRDRRRRRVRRVHVDRLRPAGVDRRHGLPRRAGPGQAHGGGGARFRIAAGAGMVAARRCSRSPRARSTSPCSSAGRSRSRRARSARCCCSASGGRG